MRILKSTFTAAIALLIIGCSRTVEIPQNKVGVVYNTETMVVSDHLLKTGRHSISPYSAVRLFDITEQEINFSFDVLFKDATSATLEFSIKYMFKADSLSSICQKYGQAALDYPFDKIIIIPEARSQIRDLILEFDKDKTSDHMIFHRVEESLRTHKPINKILEIRSFTRGQIKPN